MEISPAAMESRNVLQRIKGFPPVAFLLLLSCCAISVPLLIQPKLYGVLGWCDRPLKLFFWQGLTSSFAHGTPVDSMPPPLPHFLGNAVMIVLLGGVIERVLGSGRFFLLTLATLATHTVWKLTIGGGNGASGFCWGYTVFIVPILAWEWRRRGRRVLWDPLYIGLAAVTAFALLGVALFLWAAGRGLWNGTNEAHLYSILTALPLVFLWRKALRENWRRLGEGEPIERGRPWLRTAGLGTVAVLLTFNLAVTGLAVGGRAARPVLAVRVTPPSGEIAALNASRQQVTIGFNLPMAEKIDSIGTSISRLEDKERLDFTYVGRTPRPWRSAFRGKSTRAKASV